MDTIRYVFETRQPQLNGLVVKYGLTPAVNQKDLWMKTNFLVKKFREDFMKDVADIHPDKDLFAWRFSLDNKPKDIETSNESKQFESRPSTSELQNILSNTTVIPPSKTSSCCGSGADGEKTSGCCGSGADGEKTSGCSGCDAMKKSSITGTEIKEKLQNNMPLVIVGSLALVVGLIALSGRKFA